MILTIFLILFALSGIIIFIIIGSNTPASNKIMISLFSALFISAALLIGFMIFSKVHKNEKQIFVSKEVISTDSTAGEPKRYMLVDVYKEECTFLDCSETKENKFIRYVDIKELKK